MEQDIIIRGVIHRYVEKQILNGINLTIERGEIFGLLGPSGAGKTTLIKILTGQLVQTAGEAYVMGADCRYPDGELYTKMGIEMDSAGLYERLTCYDNLDLFRRIYGLPVSRIGEVLRAVGLEDAKRTAVMKLSKGMKGRLVLARAIMNTPQLLFLDEPTSGLDPASASEIRRLIRAQKERGATVFLTTHNMGEATELCDHVALLHEGNIVEYGEPGELCRRYNHQKRIYILLKDGGSMTFANDRSCVEKLSKYLENEAVETIHSTEPDLETVFMELTGRRFE